MDDALLPAGRGQTSILILLDFRRYCCLVWWVAEVQGNVLKLFWVIPSGTHPVTRDKKLPPAPFSCRLLSVFFAGLSCVDTELLGDTAWTELPETATPKFLCTAEHCCRQRGTAWKPSTWLKPSKTEVRQMADRKASLRLCQLSAPCPAWGRASPIGVCFLI